MLGGLDNVGGDVGTVLGGLEASKGHLGLGDVCCCSGTPIQSLAFFEVWLGIDKDNPHSTTPKVQAL